MPSALWRQTGGIWPCGVSCSLTWYDLGAIAHVIQTAHIRSVLEIGVEHGGLSAWLMAYCRYTGCAYRGVDITLNALQTRVRDLDSMNFVECDAWAPANVREAGLWIIEQPAPCLIICDGHDYHNEYADDAIATVPAKQVHADWLDDTLLCMWIKA